MKLKKIASLALAGVMAVSMLTACGDANTIDDNKTPNEPDTTPVAGYSSVFEDRLTDAADANISMSDSADLNTALKFAMEFMSDSKIAYDYDQNWKDTATFIKADISGTNGTNNTDLHKVAVELVKKADTDRESMNKDLADVFDVLNPNEKNAVAYDKNNVDIVLLYAVDGGLSTDAAVMEVADALNNEIRNLVRTWSLKDSVETTGEAVYNYTGSVSADTITLDANHGKSMTFVAVEIVRELA